MKTLQCHCWMAAVVAALGTPAFADVLADSVADFSTVQGQSGWSYGFFDQGPVSGDHNYTAESFELFASFDSAASTWEATDAQVGAQNNEFLGLDQDGGHPTGLGPDGQDRIIWAVRRYQNDIEGMVDIAFDLRKRNFQNPRGGGVTGRIFVDGTEVFTQFVQNDDNTGTQGLIVTGVTVGSVIDFAIDPTGQQPAEGSDGLFAARADGSIFSAVISNHIPEPTTASVLWVGIAGLMIFRTSCRLHPKK